jgi:hypothetical protein
MAIGGQPYTDTLIAIHGTAPLSWSVISGALPTGISLSSAGIISGTTTVPNGIYKFTAQVKDAAGDSSPAAFSLTVNRPREPDNPSNTLPGLAYSYYEGTWSNLPAFASLTPVKTGTCSTFVLTMRNVDVNYGIRFSGYVDVPVDGNYTFFTNSDDGSRLFIGTDTIVKNDGSHGPAEQSGSILLKAGKHAITVDYFQGTGGGSLSVSWQRTGGAKTAIPDSVLSHGGIVRAFQPASAEMRNGGIVSLSETTKGIAISVGTHESWTLELFNLNGARSATFTGIGSAILHAGQITKNQPAIAVLRMSGRVIGKLFAGK